MPVLAKSRYLLYGNFDIFEFHDRLTAQLNLGLFLLLFYQFPKVVKKIIIDIFYFKLGEIAY